LGAFFFPGVETPGYSNFTLSGCSPHNLKFGQQRRVFSLPVLYFVITVSNTFISNHGVGFGVRIIPGLKPRAIDL
jgi:hypothetical protein